MDKETRYRYEKRIQQLRDDRERLYAYRSLALKIYSHLISEPLTAMPKISYLLEQFKDVMK